MVLAHARAIYEDDRIDEQGMKLRQAAGEFPNG